MENNGIEWNGRNRKSEITCKKSYIKEFYDMACGMEWNEIECK